MSGRILSIVLLALVVVLALASLLAGRVWLPPGEVADALAAPDDTLAGLIISELRLPRMILAIGVGASLGLAGAVLQGLLRNPLAEAGLLGVSTGAALGAVLAIYYGAAASFALATPLMGLAGGFIAAALAFALSRSGGTLALILAGAAVSSVGAAGLALALNLAPNPYAVFEIATWLLGSLSDRTWDHVWLGIPFMLVGCGLLFLTAPALDALSVGEAQAESLGINLKRARLMALGGTAMAVGAATAVTGAVGFIGLVAPHLVRPFVGYRPARVLLPSALLGAALLLAADIASRLISYNTEIKLGVLTSIFGAPFFLWLVLSMRKRAP